ncbi:hypothetical protein GCM10010976_29200 [Bizionia arctica]|uniref:Uncharacterized protein n=1 Tax=Bizionia arctica TaxID=1495645 RepID=A0A917GSZ9_9FLAO|nr:hypothetical protein GCM10010976_29200 [Bizionia arctica]
MTQLKAISNDNLFDYAVVLLMGFLFGGSFRHLFNYYTEIHRVKKIHREIWIKKNSENL